MKQTERQLKIEALGRLVAHAETVAEANDGFRDDFARTMRKIKRQLATRRRKLEIKELQGGNDG